MQKMKWGKLITAEKVFSSVQVNDNNARTEFERDHNKIVFSPFFRQLQNKTQLFPITNGDFIHSRLTHSLEVASVGQSLGNLVAQQIIENNLSNDLPDNFSIAMADIVSAACLLHDIGNPPFGHAGEDAISSFYSGKASVLEPYMSSEMIKHLSHYDGNAQALRFINNSNDLNLTLSTIAAVIKYPTSYDTKSIYGDKYSIFVSELKLLEKVAAACGLNKYQSVSYCRHPLAFLVEAADDICYRLLDLEDAHKLGLIDYRDAERLFFQIIKSRKDKNLELVSEHIDKLTVEDKFARLRSYALNVLIGEAVNQFMVNYDEIMTGQYNKLIINGKLNGLIDLLMVDNSGISVALSSINKLIVNKVYLHKPILEVELAGYEILGYLLEQFIGAALNIHNERSNISNISKKSLKLMQLLPDKFRIGGASVEEQIMLITDYIASQSDNYALNLYRKLKPGNDPLINMVQTGEQSDVDYLSRAFAPGYEIGCEIVKQLNVEETIGENYIVGSNIANVFG